ncbi:MAG: DUF5675 family protein [Candidatus Thorarchaeota archaeon]|jgi:hypothetical protein
MELRLTRFSGGDEATLGLLRVDGKFFCYTLEDQFNEPKVPGETRIPAGRYKIDLRTEGGMTQRYEKRFDFHAGMLWLRDIPNFQFVYIHTGNNDDHSEGCILVGDGQVQNVTERGSVQSSVAAYTRLYDAILGALAQEEVWITIEDES